MPTQRTLERERERVRLFYFVIEREKGLQGGFSQTKRIKNKTKLRRIHKRWKKQEEEANMYSYHIFWFTHNFTSSPVVPLFLSLSLLFLFLVFNLIFSLLWIFVCRRKSNGGYWVLLQQWWGFKKAFSLKRKKIEF